MAGKQKTDGDPDNESEHDDDDGSEDGDDDGKVFTQSDLNSLLTRENKRGRRAAEKSITDLLGGRKPQEVKELLDKLDEQSSTHLTEAQRIQKEADDVRSKADQDIERAADAALRAEILEALLAPEDGEPLNPDRRKLAVDIVFQHTSRNDLDDIDEAIADGVGYLRKQSPEWFAQPNGEGSKGTTPPPGRKGRESAGRQVRKSDRKTRAEQMLARFSDSSVDRRPFPKGD